MAEKRVLIPLGTLDLDRGPLNGGHLWGVHRCYHTKNGYASLAVDYTGSASAFNVPVLGAHIHTTSATVRGYVGSLLSLYQNSSGGALTNVSRSLAPYLGAAYNATLTGPAWSFASFGPFVYATDGVDNIQIINNETGTQFVDITVPATCANPAAKYIISHKNHIVIAGITLAAPYGGGILAAGDQPLLVWWSGLDNGSAFGDSTNAPSIDGTGWKQVFDGDGIITGLVGGYDAAFIFKDRSIHRMDGPPFQINCIANGVGCKYHKSIVRLNDRIYFWSTNGPAYVDTRSNEVVLLSKELMNASFVDSLNPRQGASVGSWPEITVGTSFLSFDESVLIRNTVQAMVDDAHRLIAFIWPNTLASSHGEGVWAGALYSEDTEAWTGWAPYGVSASTLALTGPGVSDSYYNAPMTRTAIWGHATGGITKYTLANNAGTGKATFVLPFLPFTDAPGTVSRILAIRPIFVHGGASTSGANPLFQVEIQTNQGPWNRWPGTRTTELTPITSFDGFIQLPNTKYGVSHAILFNVGYGSGASQDFFVGLSALEVIYDVMGKRSG